jgi:hypothetical protein
MRHRDNLERETLNLNRIHQNGHNRPQKLSSSSVLADSFGLSCPFDEEEAALSSLNQG